MEYGRWISNICLLKNIILFCFLLSLSTFLWTTSWSTILTDDLLWPGVKCTYISKANIETIISWFVCWSRDLSWHSDSPPGYELASMCLWSHMSGMQTDRTQWSQSEGCMKHHNHLGQLVHNPWSCQNMWVPETSRLLKCTLHLILLKIDSISVNVVLYQQRWDSLVSKVVAYEFIRIPSLVG
jgi:hypothetical protein